MKKVLCFMIAIVMFATVMTGCGGSVTQQQAAQTNTTDNAKKTGDATATVDPKNLPELRVGTIGFGVISVGVEHMVQNGWDVANGFKVKEIVFPSGVPINEAIGADTIDVATTGFAGVVGVPNYNEKLLAEIGESNTCAIYVRKDSPIAKVKGVNPKYPDVYGDPASVKGKSIICGVGTLTQFAVNSWLGKIGVKDTEVKLVNMDTAPGLQAFQAGKADAVVLNSLLMYQGVKQQDWVQVADYKTMGIKNYDLLVANPKAYDSKKELLTKFVKQLFRANDALMAPDGKLADEAKAWADKNGTKVDIEAFKWQITQDPLLTSDKVKANIGNMGSTLKQLGQFQVSVGKLQADKIQLFDKNITPDILKAALDIK